ncbi:hypothetical protein BsWGS_07945 [Bradybaena similaris]
MQNLVYINYSFTVHPQVAVCELLGNCIFSSLPLLSERYEAKTIVQIPSKATCWHIDCGPRTLGGTANNSQIHHGNKIGGVVNKKLSNSFYSLCQIDLSLFHICGKTEQFVTFYSAVSTAKRRTSRHILTSLAIILA